MHDALTTRRSQWWVGYLLGPNESYLNKGPGYLDPRWAGVRLGCPQIPGFRLSFTKTYTHLTCHSGFLWRGRSAVR